MSFKKYSPLLLELNHSAYLLRLIAVIHALALVACVVNSLPFLIKGVMFVVIAIHYYFQAKQLNAKQYIIKHTETAGWELSTGGEFVAVAVLPSTVISTVAIFLHLKTESKARQNLVIASDALAENDYRRLIVHLKTTLHDKENSDV
jgi:predicted membrane protein